MVTIFKAEMKASQLSLPEVIFEVSKAIRDFTFFSVTPECFPHQNYRHESNLLNPSLSWNLRGLKFFHKCSHAMWRFALPVSSPTQFSFQAWLSAYIQATGTLYLYESRDPWPDVPFLLCRSCHHAPIFWPQLAWRYAWIHSISCQVVLLFIAQHFKSLISPICANA